MDRPVEPWSRRRLIALAVGVGLVVVMLVVGLGLAVRSAVTHARHDDAPESSGGQATGEAVDRDAVLAAPMLPVSEQDSRQGVPAATPAAALTVPNSTTTGPARVVSGFPHTPEGAVGQLAAIEQTVLMAMDVARAREVHQAWTVPGAVSVEAWPLMGNVRSFLGSARMGDQLDSGASVTAVPVGAQVKGVDGPDWVVACVLMDVRALVRVESRMAYGYCEAMAWRRGRWMIASPRAAAVAPSTWPGTDLAREAGWRTWHVAGE